MATTTSMPSTRRLVTSLISSLRSSPPPGPEQQPSANPLQDASDGTKQTILTLHVLFPNEFLPALDLLDCGLVTRLHLRDQAKQVEGGSTALPSSSTALPRLASAKQQSNRAAGKASRTGAYYVRSGQQPWRTTSSRARPSAYQSATHHEVHIDSWSCSCPAFAFAAFARERDDGGRGAEQRREGGRGEAPHIENRHGPAAAGARSADSGGEWSFGGLTRGSDMPVCKHLLACVLVERGEMFALCVEERVVSAAEMGGWGAGWGD